MAESRADTAPTPQKPSQPLRRQLPDALQVRLSLPRRHQRRLHVPELRLLLRAQRQTAAHVERVVQVVDRAALVVRAPGQGPVRERLCARARSTSARPKAHRLRTIAHP